VRLGSRDPLKPDDPKAPKPLASGIVRKTAAAPDKPAGTKPAGSAGAASGAASGPGKQTGRSAERQAPRAADRGASGAPLPAAEGSRPGLLDAGGRPALALIESASIAVGFQVADAIVKKAPVRLLRAQTASPGKFIVLFAGDVASVEEAHRAGVAACGDSLLDELLLAHAHPTVLPALEALTAQSTLDSFAVIETFTLAAAILAADSAVKAAPVALIEIRPPVGLGGKSFLTLTGGLEDLQAAVETALERIRPGGMICRHVLIPNPHGDLLPFVF